MPKPPSNPSKYCDEPNADNAGFDCLCEQAADNAQQEPFCGLTKTWSGTLAVAKAKCDASADCKFLHDWKADGQHWRACRTIKSPGDGKAAIKKKSSSGKCADLPQGDADFDRMDADKSGSISREEFNKAVAAGVISDTSALKPAPAAPTSAPTAAPTSAPTSAPKPAPAPAAPAPVFTDPIFNRVDKNNNNKITEGEFNKAIAAGTIIVKS